MRVRPPAVDPVEVLVTWTQRAVVRDDAHAVVPGVVTVRHSATVDDPERAAAEVRADRDRVAIADRISQLSRAPDGSDGLHGEIRGRFDEAVRRAAATPLSSERAAVGRAGIGEGDHPIAFDGLRCPRADHPVAAEATAADEHAPGAVVVRREHVSKDAADLALEQSDGVIGREAGAIAPADAVADLLLNVRQVSPAVGLPDCVVKPHVLAGVALRQIAQQLERRHLVDERLRELDPFGACPAELAHRDRRMRLARRRNEKPDRHKRSDRECAEDNPRRQKSSHE